MNKLLTTITLICFSVAANADIYFCQSEYGTVVLADGSEPNIEEELFTLVVDTEQGVRGWFNETADYAGQCDSESVVRCKGTVELDDGIYELYLSLFSDSLSFIYSMRHSESVETVGIISLAGTCTKA